ncbi:hypothetical protein CEUSTIGMA_g6374.t1 [Chlamydomonas eustigma]|uniref:Uncharacterized protein n=1 Tax=Chlamydomonas eustigma TaxID=1157962 RepID=A0A250X773_9CHLO|nr:hypothetical protein CEUSTIGMA_g6374.t1 [Chlamydomonas eustigma]|eukprot:GAX78934.1 hypothetical protein CEUSTIGMA_g6374.t1 [Chlamydomonas eustigma]
MGVSDSRDEKRQYVLVPPLFEREVRKRSRFAKSSYDFLFSKQSLHWLFSDYLTVHGVHGKLLFSPPVDPSITVKTKLSIASGSNMILRYQPYGPDQTGTFVEVKAFPLRPGQTFIRGCAFNPKLGVGIFGTLPVVGGSYTKSSITQKVVGVRYSSPAFTCGMTVSPMQSMLRQMWMAARFEGITAGVKLEATGGGFSNSPMHQDIALRWPWTLNHEELLSWLRLNSSFAVSYSPVASLTSPSTGGRRNFTASLELVQGALLVTSFHQHMAVTRRTLNPLESQDVVGITNYIDIGIQMVTPLLTSDNDGSTADAVDSRNWKPSVSSAISHKAEVLEPGLNIAASWQANKNWLVKARVGTSSAAASVGVRAWFEPSIMLAGCVQYGYPQSCNRSSATEKTSSHAALSSSSLFAWSHNTFGNLRFGILIQIENFGALKYERGSQEYHGRALLQRHEATDVDVANFEGRQEHVEEKLRNNPEGQAEVSYL